VTDPGSVVAGLFTNVTLGIPLLLVTVLLLFWVLSRFEHFPPLFRARDSDRAWTDGPFAWVEQGASMDRIAPAIAYASYRVDQVLRLRYGVTSPPTTPIWLLRRRIPADAFPLVRASRELSIAHRLAWLAEREDLQDFVSRWRRPSWRRNARAKFAVTLDALERLLPPLEVVL